MAPLYAFALGIIVIMTILAFPALKDEFWNKK